MSKRNDKPCYDYLIPVNTRNSLPASVIDGGLARFVAEMIELVLQYLRDWDMMYS